MSEILLPTSINRALPRWRNIAAPFLVLVLAAGCSSKTSSYESSAAPKKAATTTTTEAPRPISLAASGIQCEAQEPQGWTGVDPRVNAEVLADVLGVTIEQVEEGDMGPAHCQEGIPGKWFGVDTKTVTVAEVITPVSKQCIAIGAAGNEGEGPPEAGKTYQDLLVICPAVPQVLAPPTSAM